MSLSPSKQEMPRPAEEGSANGSIGSYTHSPAIARVVDCIRSKLGQSEIKVLQGKSRDNYRDIPSASKLLSSSQTC